MGEQTALFGWDWQLVTALFGLFVVLPFSVLLAYRVVPVLLGLRPVGTPLATRARAQNGELHQDVSSLSCRPVLLEVLRRSAFRGTLAKARGTPPCARPEAHPMPDSVQLLCSPAQLRLLVQAMADLALRDDLPPADVEEAEILGGGLADALYQVDHPELYGSELPIYALDA